MSQVLAAERSVMVMADRLWPCLLCFALLFIFGVDAEGNKSLLS